MTVATEATTAITAPEETRTVSRANYDLLHLLPFRGEWTEQDYLWLSGRTNRLVELVDGRIEAVPVPTEHRQAIAIFSSGRYAKLLHVSEESPLLHLSGCT